MTGGIPLTTMGSGFCRICVPRQSQICAYSLSSLSDCAQILIVFYLLYKFIALSICPDRINSTPSYTRENIENRVFLSASE